MKRIFNRREKRCQIKFHGVETVFITVSGAEIMTFDIVIQAARIVDGTGSAWFQADVGIKDGKIVLAGNLLSGTDASRVINGAGRYLMPGFIDTHTHCDFQLLGTPDLAYKLAQGVTTVGIGQCGFSAAPVTDKYAGELDLYLGFAKAGVQSDWSWRSFGQWLDHLGKQALGVNVFSFIGHGTLRISQMGFDNRKVTDDDIRTMARVLRQCRDQGAAGLTSGLIYPPGVWAGDREISGIAAGLSATRGVYESHMRNEAGELLASVAETIDVGRKNNIPVVISHHKVCGSKNFGLVEQSLELIDAARHQGIDVTANQYPYDVSSTMLRSILPGWVHEGGFEAMAKRLADPELKPRIIEEIELSEEFDNMYRNSGGADGVILLYFPKTPQYEGKSLARAAVIHGKPPLETAFDLILSNPGEDTCGFCVMSSKDVATVLRHPAVFVASDTIPGAPGAKVHPRTYGTFPKILDTFVKKEKVLRLEDAVRRMSGFPAQRMGLGTKGIIRTGMDADLILVDMDRICDQSSFDQPDRPPLGIDLVIVNGIIAMESGKYTKAESGKVLRCGKS